MKLLPPYLWLCTCSCMPLLPQATMYCCLTTKITVALPTFSSSIGACWQIQSGGPYFCTGKKHRKPCAQNSAAPPWSTSVPVLHAHPPAESVSIESRGTWYKQAIYIYHTWYTSILCVSHHVYKKFIGRKSQTSSTGLLHFCCKAKTSQFKTQASY